MLLEAQLCVSVDGNLCWRSCWAIYGWSKKSKSLFGITRQASFATNAAMAAIQSYVRLLLAKQTALFYTTSFFEAIRGFSFKISLFCSQSTQAPTALKRSSSAQVGCARGCSSCQPLLSSSIQAKDSPPLSKASFTLTDQKTSRLHPFHQTFSTNLSSTGCS